jgi:septal ring factor EnvC (AmiA/AmiB activator)
MPFGAMSPTTGPATVDREQDARRRIEDSEHVRLLEIDAERQATEQAAQALEDAMRLTAEQTEAFERLKRAEAAVGEINRRLALLSRRRTDAQTRVEKRIEVLRSILPIVLRMSTYPVETLLATRLPAEDAIRGIMVLHGISRQAEIDVRALEADREALDEASKAVETVASQLSAAEAARAAEADIVARKLALTKGRREAAEEEVAIAARQAAAEASRATSLRAMLAIFETQRKLAEAQANEDALRARHDQKANETEAARLRQAANAPSVSAGTIAADAKPSGQVTPPVTGVLVRGWGETENGEPATGQSWQTEPGARVMAPCGGTVAFAEPFRDYGLLVIIDCGGGYHAVLSGMEKIAVGPGRALHIGDPVGIMQVATKTASSGGPTALGPPILYFELRKGGRPVDPAPWIKIPG